MKQRSVGLVKEMSKAEQRWMAIREVEDRAKQDGITDSQVISMAIDDVLRRRKLEY